MRFMFAHRDRYTKNRALASGRHAQRQQHGGIPHLPVNADFFVAGIQQQIGRFAQRTGAPAFEHGVELRGGATDLRRGQFDAT